MLGKEESEFLKEHEVCRLATVSGDGTPHVVPVCYILEGKHIYIVTDYGTKKYRNILENPRVALVVDEYRPGRHKAVVIQGEAEVLERGQEFRRISQLFFRRFKWARMDRWEEGETPMLKIKPLKVISWGLK